MSLEGISRDQMAHVLKRDKLCVYSKLQKHIKMLQDSLVQCEDVLKEFAKNKKNSIQLSSNCTELFQYIYSCEEYASFLKFLIAKDLTEIDLPSSLKNFLGNQDCMKKNLINFVPTFLNRNTQEPVSGKKIIMGLKFEDIIEIKECIKMEMQAHSRNKPGSVMLKKRQLSASSILIDEMQEQDKKQILDKEALETLKNRQFSVINPSMPPLVLTQTMPYEIDFFTQSLSNSPMMLKEQDSPSHVHQQFESVSTHRFLADDLSPALKP